MLAIVTAILLGVGLAASCGLRTFLPLLMLGLAAHFHLAGVTLNDHLAWVASTPSLITLGLATVAELAADKIPLVDHGLHLAGAVTRPAAGALAVAAVFQHADPGTAALIGLIVGAPTALGVGAVQGATRLGSTGLTGGLGSPVVSAGEDLLTFGLAATSMLAPMLIPLLLIAAVAVILRLNRRKRPA